MQRTLVGGKRADVSSLTRSAMTRGSRGHVSVRNDFIFHGGFKAGRWRKRGAVYFLERVRGQRDAVAMFSWLHDM